ncbi:unnamed protein product [Lepeophtheirus salmonis]|nr:unnamed protein product [Lepeophtheirus salmonis]CAF3036006.1 unnamed protein product [Lepeophtheirus salmonis]
MMIRRLKKALGWKDRVEELMESPPIGNISSQIMTLYFGGDIQDLKDRMLVRPQAKKFAEERCLESICKVLRIAFEYDRIVIVRPSELFDGIFSRFSNWVECDSHGNPSFKNKDYDSLIHLE